MREEVNVRKAEIYEIKTTHVACLDEEAPKELRKNNEEEVAQ